MASEHRHRVVFLDFDGVLNTRAWAQRPDYLENPLDPACVAHLAHLVAESRAEVVLSTAWRGDGLAACQRHLKAAGFTAIERVVGLTAPSSPLGFGRGHEILDWVDLHDVERFVVLDDHASLAEVADHHVRPDPEVGLTAADVCSALAVLARPAPEPVRGHQK